MTLTTARQRALDAANERAERVAVAADLLRFICDDAWESDSETAMQDAVKVSALRDCQVADIIRAFDELADDRSDSSLGLPWAVSCALEEYSTPLAVVRALVEVQDEMPDRLASRVEAAVSGFVNMRTLLKSTELYALRLDVFEQLSLGVSRTAYLWSCLDNLTPKLNDQQHEFLLVLAEDWVGSFESLAATARLLRPEDPALSACRP